jgi:hypothetical protein
MQSHRGDLRPRREYHLSQWGLPPDFGRCLDVYHGLKAHPNIPVANPRNPANIRKQIQNSLQDKRPQRIGGRYTLDRSSLDCAVGCSSTDGLPKSAGGGRHGLLGGRYSEV